MHLDATSWFTCVIFRNLVRRAKTWPTRFMGESGAREPPDARSSTSSGATRLSSSRCSLYLLRSPLMFSIYFEILEFWLLRSRYL